MYGYIHQFDITVHIPRRPTASTTASCVMTPLNLHFGIPWIIFTIAEKNNIVFNPEKFHFAKDEVEFAGFSVTADSEVYQAHQ